MIMKWKACKMFKIEQKRQMDKKKRTTPLQINNLENNRNKEKRNEKINTYDYYTIINQLWFYNIKTFNKIQK